MKFKQRFKETKGNSHLTPKQFESIIYWKTIWKKMRKHFFKENYKQHTHTHLVLIALFQSWFNMNRKKKWMKKL